MSNVITSPQNQIVKEVKSLHLKSNRDKLGEFFVEGLRIVEDALQSRAFVEFAVVSESGLEKEEIRSMAQHLMEHGVLAYSVSDRIYKELSDTETPQGILAVIKKPRNTFNKTIKDGQFYILLENIQDPGNMGTIIRTADAAGASGVIVSKGSVDVYNPKVLRSTMGSIFHLPIIKSDNLEETITELKNHDFNILAAHLDGNTNHFDVNMRHKTAIVIGNEANGISQAVTNQCQLIKIPMLGKSESLNASVSAAVIIYEYVRQKLS